MVLNGPHPHPRRLARLMFATVLLLLPAFAQAAPALFYSDLDSGPKTGGQNGRGVFVTVWGKGFGSTRGNGYVTVGGGQVDPNYVSWADEKIVFELGANAATGNIVVRNNGGESSNGIPFTVRTGRILFVTPSGTGNGSYATPMSPYQVYTGMQAGDTYYFRAGTYNRDYDTANWNETNYNLGSGKGGTAGNPVAFVGYPGETAVIQAVTGAGRANFHMRDGDSSDRHANYVTIANFTLRGESQNIDGGAVTRAYAEVAKSGAAGLRVVNNIMSCSYGNNTMSGMLTVGGDGARIYGNVLKDTGTSPPINNNHAMYIQVGSSDVDIGWNKFQNLRMGHTLQVHTDTAFQYTNIRIHDNEFSAAALGDSRGINIGNALSGTSGSIYNNILFNLGQNFSAIAIYWGDWRVYNNTLYNIQASSGMIWVSGQYGGRPTAQLYNNILYSNGSSPYIGAHQGATLSQITLNSNLYFNYSGGTPSGDSRPITGNPLFTDTSSGILSNFRLQTASPAIDAGTSSVSTVVTTDHDGAPRPQGGAHDVGAYESSGVSLAKPTGLTIQRL